MATSWTASNIGLLTFEELESGTCNCGCCDTESGEGLTSVLLSLLGVALLRPVITHLRRRKIADIYDSLFQLQKLASLQFLLSQTQLDMITMGNSLINLQQLLQS